ncbi:MAG: biotin-dependent carboxyltransferase family protein [Flavobacteriales bacterium]|nr:biotin-dependent carboxyltransferase family protein [Flavobacteriia bacterium]NCP07009.1 biotin-dependent carboxyltransferase family protein [Flavobacteriales bacterium]PIV95062.1 MAG: allophanate hydrolase [Flavobacteriaceae bacterium CG17_big_fil_post_rev_8_21_14_2_50_33_15]PIY09286.1 MAG: allophanate hydrolase [Flavobacteriaceae bacterium CG_4_10_14_3_um_filter_33_47]PJB20260.1 MAG: allophanate hydrolase [Flavobacteriaceae bacterium CG_4_9_14_3_um_filter_33_16]
MVEVLKEGFYDSIQDLGRFGYQQYGVPVSGVMDTYAATFANSLLGNEVKEAVMEITMTGPKLKFHCHTTFCISGANLSPCLNNMPIKMNQIVRVTDGDMLSFGKHMDGLRSYLAVFGGFQTEIIYQSKSMYQGITNHFKINKNDLLSISENTAFFNKKHASIKRNDSYLNTKVISVFKGPEFDQLSENQIKALFSKEFSISKHHNRMAYQLEQPLENHLEPIITSLVMPGTVQLTPDGKLIVLMRDCQTTGGYPRIFQLEESSMNVLSQKFTGQTIRFKWVQP